MRTCKVVLPPNMALVPARLTRAFLTCPLPAAACRRVCATFRRASQEPATCHDVQSRRPSARSWEVRVEALECLARSMRHLRGGLPCP
jgi:hypothetical protein